MTNDTLCELPVLDFRDDEDLGSIHWTEANNRREFMFGQLRMNDSLYHPQYGWYMDTFDGNIGFVQKFSVSLGQWNTAAPSPGRWHSFIVSYNNSSSANNPIFYLNGISVSVTEIPPAPSGTAVAETSNIDIGYDASYSPSTFNGKLKDMRIYNRILTQAEVTILATSSNINKHVVQDGLVFWCPCAGTAGVTTFEGLTLTSSHKILDIIGSNQGTPAGSPIGRDTITLWSGHGADSFSSAVPSVAQKLYLNDSGVVTNTQVVVGTEAIINKDYISFPQVTTTERDALSVAVGTVVWNTTTTQLEVYKAGGWVAVAA